MAYIHHRLKRKGFFFGWVDWPLFDGVNAIM